MGKVIADFCERVLNNINAGPLSATLFSNDHTPDYDDAPDASDYTPPTGTGVDPILLYDWDDVVKTDGRAEATHGLTWNPSGALTGYVYGVVIREYMTGYLVGAVRFDTPILLEEGVPIVYNLKGFVKDPAAA